MKKSKLFCILLPVIIAIATTACQGGNSTSTATNGGSKPLAPTVASTQLSVDDMTAIPVVNGNSTQGKVYIRNYSDKDLSNVSISLAQASNSAQLKTKKTNSVKARANGLNNVNTDENGFKILNASSCSTIKANNFCALDVVTPSLKPGASGNATVKISFTDSNGNAKTYNKIVNYRYVDTTSTTGVNFADGSVSAIGAQGSTRHVVGYLIGGGTAGTIHNNVKLRISKPGEVAIANGFVNGTQVAAAQAIPVEFLVDLNGSVQTGVSITPVVNSSVVNSATTKSNQSNAKKSLQSEELLGTSLTVTLIPGLNTSHLVFGDLPTLFLESSTTASIPITVTNNGNADVSGPTVVNDNSGAVSVNNPCASITLEANAANYCVITYTVNSTSSGVANLTYESSDGATIVGSDALYWFNNDLVPALSIKPSIDNFSVVVGSSTQLAYTLTNSGTATLDNIEMSYKMAGLGEFTQTATTCNTDAVHPGKYLLNAGGSCTVTGTFTANATAMLNASMYMSATGLYNGKSYTFTSLQTIFNVTNSPILGFTSPSAGSTVLLQTLANGLESSQQIFTLTNSGNTAANITGYDLQNESAATTNQPQIDNSIVSTNPPCSANGTLAANASCDIGVKYGPIAADNTANEAGSMKLVVNYTGGTPDTPKTTEFDSIQYSLVGNDSMVTIGAPVVENLSGDGTQATPYKGNGFNPAGTVTLTYSNPSQNYPLSNLNFNTNNLPQGLTVSGGTCPTGAISGSLAMGSSCTLILSLDKNTLAKMSDGTITVNSNKQVDYPSATWTTPMGFYSESGVVDTNGKSGLYISYVQASITPSFSVESGNYSTTTLTLTAINNAGYTTLTGNVSGVSGWLSTLPVGSGCTVNSTDYSASCDLVANTSASIVYTMPTYLQSGDSLDIPFMFSLGSNQFAYLSPMYEVISFTKN